MKGAGSLRAKSTSGAAQGAAATDRGEHPESWEEFGHPQFRRGRRDLLVDIKRQKDGGRLKRKRGVSSEDTNIEDSSGVDMKGLEKRLAL